MTSAEYQLTDQTQVPIADILIVDDMPNNLRLLSQMLSDQGYKVRKALNGNWALRAVQSMPPDLILLDIQMPDLDGYEVCRQIKANPKTHDIPVIFISALDEAMDKVLAFEVGGMDYITKPFQIQEVLARVNSHLNLQRLQQQLRAQNTQLQQEILERQKAETSLRVFLHAVSHDLRNPVTGMLMVLQNLLRSSSLERPDNMIAVPRAVLERMATSCDRQLNLINSLLETQKREVWGGSLQCEPIALQTFIEELITEWKPMLQKNQATLMHQIPTNLPAVSADRNQLWRVFENLLANALKHNPPGLNLLLKAEVCASSLTFLRCTLTDDGLGMKPEECAQLFQPYTRGEAAKRKTGLGLGLYLCLQIVTAHGGDIGVNSAPGAGTTFWFTLPLEKEKKC